MINKVPPTSQSNYAFVDCIDLSSMIISLEINSIVLMTDMMTCKLTAMLQGILIGSKLGGQPTHPPVPTNEKPGLLRRRGNT